MHSNILSNDETALVVVDVQEAFRDAVTEPVGLVDRVVRIVRGCGILETPIVLTEQYPKGLGQTVSEILDALPESAEIVEKSTFSSCGAADFLVALNKTGARQILVCGLETHICVNQTVHDLLDSGFQVHLLTDAVGSRFEVDKRAGIDKMIAGGAIPSSVEMALFELMRDSKHEHFRAVQAIVK